VKFMLRQAERDKRIHIEEIDHGKFERISSTSLLLNCGAPGPALKTGRPVIGSTRMRAFRRRAFRGVNTIRPASAETSSESPGRRPSFRRTGAGRTIWPFVDTLVSMVRQSYLKGAPISTLERPDRATAQHSCITKSLHEQPVEQRFSSCYRRRGTDEKYRPQRSGKTPNSRSDGSNF